MHEVAAFVDLENIRYSMLNRWHQEPDPLAWRDKARKYGLIGIARAYADFDQHPPQLRQRLNVAGFEAEHYPVKRYRDRDGTERGHDIQVIGQKFAVSAAVIILSYQSWEAEQVAMRSEV